MDMCAEMRGVWRRRRRRIINGPAMSLSRIVGDFDAVVLGGFVEWHWRATTGYLCRIWCIDIDIVLHHSVAHNAYIQNTPKPKPK